MSNFAYLIIDTDLMLSTSTSTEQPLAAIPATAAELINLFVSEKDVKASSRGTYKRTLHQFFQWIEDENLTLSTLSVADINRYKDALMNKGLSNLTVGSYVVAVRKFYEWTESKKWYPNIAKGVKTPKRKESFRKQHLTAEKASELLYYYSNERIQHIDTDNIFAPEQVARDFAIVNLILRTGLRTIEVVRADIEDITFKRDCRVLKVWGKGRTDKEEDFVILTDKAYQPIQDYLSKYRSHARAGEPLFTSISNRNYGCRLTTRTISGLCKEGLRSVGLDGKEFTAHSLRHTTAVAILKKGGTINDVQAVLRHSSVDTSRIYTKSIEEEMRLSASIEQLLDSYFI